MNSRLFCWLGALGLFAGGMTAWPLSHAQERTFPPAPEAPAGPAAAPPAANVKKAPVRDLAKMSPLQRQMFLSAQRGAEWLHGVSRPDGRFLPGYLTALKAPLEGDHYLRQAGAAFALARAARYTGDEKYAAVARQSALTLLLDTAADPKGPGARYVNLPPLVANRLAASGMLVLLINELPAPEKDLLDQSEQLCAYLRKQQQADGSFSLADNPEDAQAVADAEAVHEYPGIALYGLMLSQRHRPAAWKTEAARKALAYYQPWWQRQRSPAFVPWQTAAYTEAYLQTRERPFADFVFAMNDRLCQLQYAQLDPRHPLWLGGFRESDDPRANAQAPGIGSASCAESLAEACRVARQAGDVAHHQRYQEALVRCLQFVTTLQYTEANTQHFADWYRRLLVGGFHASHQDGNLRIDHAQHALVALVQYLTHNVE